MNGSAPAWSFALLALIGGALGCTARESGNDGGAPAPPLSAAVASAIIASASASASSSPALRGPLVREGSTVARARSGDALYVADEDHRALWIVTLPLDPGHSARSIALPGAPAQIVVTDGAVLVTIREPGLLLALRPDPTTGLIETGRVALPSDAWGLALTPDGATAIVTSAWTHRVAAIDRAALTVRWTVEVAREPRGVVVRADGAAAYVTHLVGASLTRLDDLASASPRVSRVALPASPLRAPSGRALAASLGYAATLSDDGARLFVARHALGALGDEAWFGAASVDVLLTGNDAPLAPRHSGRMPFLRADSSPQGDELRLPGGALAPFTQPRAIVYRKRTRTVLVAGEGDDAIAELDAIALDPTLAPLRRYPVGGGYDPVLPIASTCGAPSGLALAEDEATAWIHCRATSDVAELHLDPGTPGAAFTRAPPRVLHLGDAPGDPLIETGRRLFYNATDRLTSGGVACAGCHPDGRDDGFVWHEAKFNSSDGTSVNFVGSPENVPDEDHVKGVPRRTPMLVGRVAAKGPYGWHAESPTLEDRLEKGFGLHRWGALPKHDDRNRAARAMYLVAFLRRGLVPPPRDEHPATPEEVRGKAIFTSEATRCSRCHDPQSAYTDRLAYPLAKLPTLTDFDDEAQVDWKTPSLLFVGGHAPYLHDGSATSLEDLLDRNRDRMGQTSSLSKDDKAALIAYLRTL